MQRLRQKQAGLEAQNESVERSRMGSAELSVSDAKKEQHEAEHKQAGKQGVVRWRGLKRLTV